MSTVPVDSSSPGAVILPLRPNTPQPPVSRFAINLLGNFELLDRGRPVSLPATTQRLVSLLALERRVITRRRAANALWPDKPEARAIANLRSTLWRLNSSLPGLIDSEGGHLVLTDEAALDIEQLASTIISNPPARTELLADWDDEWIVVERERVRQQTLRALEAVAAELRDMGLYPEAVETGATAVRLAPLRESAHRSVIETHLAEGNYDEAVRQYELFRVALGEAFGVEPSSAMQGLFRHLLVDRSESH